MIQKNNISKANLQLYFTRVSKYFNELRYILVLCKHSQMGKDRAY